MPKLKLQNFWHSTFFFTMHPKAFLLQKASPFFYEGMYKKNLNVKAQLQLVGGDVTFAVLICQRNGGEIYPTEEYHFVSTMNHD